MCTLPVQAIFMHPYRVRDRVTQMTHNALHKLRLGNKSYRRLEGGK